MVKRGDQNAEKEFNGPFENFRCGVNIPDAKQNANRLSRENQMVDPSDRADTIEATIDRYKIGEFGVVRARAMLVLCGLNATEIEEKLAPHHLSNRQNLANYKEYR